MARGAKEASVTGNAERNTDVYSGVMTWLCGGCAAHKYAYRLLEGSPVELAPSSQWWKKGCEHELECLTCSCTILPTVLRTWLIT